MTDTQKSKMTDKTCNALTSMWRSKKHGKCAAFQSAYYHLEISCLPREALG